MQGVPKKPIRQDWMGHFDILEYDIPVPRGKMIDCVTRSWFLLESNIPYFLNISSIITPGHNFFDTF